MAASEARARSRGASPSPRVGRRGTHIHIMGGPGGGGGGGSGPHIHHNAPQVRINTASNMIGKANAVLDEMELSTAQLAESRRGSNPATEFLGGQQQDPSTAEASRGTARRGSASAATGTAGTPSNASANTASAGANLILTYFSQDFFFRHLT